MESQGTYLHHVPGRIRIKIPGLKRFPRRSEEIRRLLSGMDAVYSVTVSTLTGSVLIQYDADRAGMEEILETLNRHGALDASGFHPLQERVEDTGTRAGKAVRKAMVSWVVGRVLDANGLSFLAAFI